MKRDREEEKRAPITKMAELSRDESVASSSVSSKLDDRINLKEVTGGGATPSPSTNKTDTPNSDISKAKSCKGCLYYSSRFKADSRNPVCAGLTRSLPNLPQMYVGQSEMEASKEGRTLKDFRYACVGYSLYADQKRVNFNGKDTQTELPVCLGFEVLMDQRVNTAGSESAAPGTHIHNRNDGKGLPQRQSPNATNSTAEVFLGRFARNANLIANGVVKNTCRVGNQIKQGLDNILSPDGRRPK